jgi:hypothetical protein
MTKRWLPTPTGSSKGARPWVTREGTGLFPGEKLW